MAGNHGIKKILVALDDSPSSMSALQNAVELASHMGADLIGRYVEDINLLRFAQLPSARELTFYAPVLRRLEPRDLEYEMRLQAERIRRLMARICDKWNVSWEFKVTRGQVATELMGSSAEADLLVIGKLGRSFPTARRTGSITRMVISKRPGMTLILEKGAFLSFPVILLYDSSEHGKRALEAAIRLNWLYDGKLVVMLMGSTRGENELLSKEVMAHPMTDGVKVEFRLIPSVSMSGIAGRIGREGRGPVVLPCGAENVDADQLCELVDGIKNPVLLIR